MSASKPSHASEGYIDLQVNGFAGVDFNGHDLTVAQLHKVCRGMREDGAAGFLPTVITADLAEMAARLSRIAAARQVDPLAAEMVLGIHIEGPCISPVHGFVGAHPVHDVRPMRLDEMKRLVDAADGLARIVTLAPELDDGLRLTRHLADQGLTVAAGHCNPSLDQLRAAMDAGLTMFTHLGNGCPQHLPRHDNIIQRVLSLSDELWISFIADGAHVPFPALRNYLRAARNDRCVIVSDAISATGLGPGRYSLGHQWVDIGEDHIPRSADGTHFVGSATSISQMVTWLRRDLQLADDEIQQLVCIGPRKILPGGQQTY